MSGVGDVWVTTCTYKTGGVVTTTAYEYRRSVDGMLEDDEPYLPTRVARSGEMLGSLRRSCRVDPVVCSQVKGRLRFMAGTVLVPGKSRWG